MFIHSRKIQFRAAALVFGCAVLYSATLINPFTLRASSATGNAVLWAAFLLFLVIVGFCVYLWRMTSNIPNATLPDPTQWHKPNYFPARTRVLNTIGSLSLLTYGTYGLYINDILIPGKRGAVMHLSGTPAWLMYIAMLAAAANMLAVVVDHYDKRNNERSYVHFAVSSQWLGWSFFIVALTWNLFLQK